MQSVINSKDKNDAIKSCEMILSYYPYRYAAIVDMYGQWGYCSGKTKARMNNLARHGFNVFIVKRMES